MRETMTRGELRVIADTDHVQCGDAAAMASMLLELLDQKPVLHRFRRVNVEPFGPYPWSYGEFTGFSDPIDGIEDEYFYAAPAINFSVPDGWKLVPVEPTDEMCKAGYEAKDKWPSERADTKKEMRYLWTKPRYKAMIDAAPAAPAAPDQEV